MEGMKRVTKASIVEKFTVAKVASSVRIAMIADSGHVRLKAVANLGLKIQKDEDE